MSSHREMGERGKGPASALRSPGEPFILKVPQGFNGKVTLLIERAPDPEPLPSNSDEPQGEVGT